MFEGGFGGAPGGVDGQLPAAMVAADLVALGFEGGDMGEPLRSLTNRSVGNSRRESQDERQHKKGTTCESPSFPFTGNPRAR